MAQTGSFGDIIFEVSAELVKTWENLRSKKQAVYASHDLAAEKSKLEFTGVELHEISFDVRLDARFLNPSEESAKLSAAMESGESKVLVIGGKPLGEYVLNDITEQTTHTDARGRTLTSRLKLNFKEYN